MPATAMPSPIHWLMPRVRVESRRSSPVPSAIPTNSRSVVASMPPLRREPRERPLVARRRAHAREIAQRHQRAASRRQRAIAWELRPQGREPPLIMQSSSPRMATSRPLRRARHRRPKASEIRAGGTTTPVCQHGLRKSRLQSWPGGGQHLSADAGIRPQDRYAARSRDEQAQPGSN